MMDSRDVVLPAVWSGTAARSERKDQRLWDFLYSAGGRLVEEDEDGTWRCVFDTEEAVSLPPL